MGNRVEVKQDWAMPHELFKLYDGFKEAHQNFFCTSVDFKLSIRKSWGKKQERNPREKQKCSSLQEEGFMPIMQLFLEYFTQIPICFQ